MPKGQLLKSIENICNINLSKVNENYRPIPIPT